MGEVRVIPNSDNEGASLNFPETCPGCCTNKIGTYPIDISYIDDMNDLLLSQRMYRIEIPICQRCFMIQMWVVAQVVFQYTTVIAVSGAIILGLAVGMPEGWSATVL